MKIKFFVGFTPCNLKGEPIGKEIKMEANSAVQAFVAMLGVGFFQANIASVPDITNTGRTLTTSSLFAVNGGSAGITNLGIVAGTGNTAVAVGNYSLQTLIPHGASGAGNLNYGATAWDTNWTTSGSNSYFKISRLLTNGSGGNITIKETGIHSRGNATVTNYFCIERTVLSSEYTVNNGTGVIITYEIKITV